MKINSAAAQAQYDNTPTATVTGVANPAAEGPLETAQVSQGCAIHAQSLGT